MTFFKTVSLIAGLALLGASAHVNVLAGGGYGDPHAILVMGIAAGVGVCSVVIGAAWSERRFLLSVAAIVVLIAGEAFGLLQTGERLIASREAMQAPVRTAEVARDKAVHRVRQAEIALAAIGATPRLVAAEARRDKAEAQLRDDASKKTCAKACIDALRLTALDAGAEVAAAHRGIDERRAAAEIELSSARSTLGAVVTPASATGLADRLGVPGWTLDLTSAALGSLAANGLGCILLVFGAHGRRHGAIAISEVLPQACLPSVDIARPVGSVKSWTVATLHPREGGRLTVTEAYRGYRDWCANQNCDPIPPSDFADEFGNVVKRIRVPVRITDGRAEVLDVMLLPAPTEIAA